MDYKNKNLPVEQRLQDLISRMTLEEKVAQLCSDLGFGLLTPAGRSTEALAEKYPHGLGRVTQYSFLGMASPRQIAKITNEVQRYFVEHTRLGIPFIPQSENLSGYPAKGGTVFPGMLGVAAAFNPEAVREMGRVIGQETRAVGIRQAMSPVIDVSRDPRWGRTYETFGEDVYLVTQMGIQYIKGLQGEGKEGVAAVAKHFLGYSETQSGMNTAATRLCPRELYEVFATPFEAADKEAEMAAIMASYSEIDGIPCGMNREIIQGLLRGRMGYDGLLVSDGAAILKLYNTFFVAKTYEDAGWLAAKAGLETEMPIGNAFRKLPEYVAAGKLEESVIDAAVRHVLKVKFEYGLFEQPYVDEDLPESFFTTEKKALVRKLADESLVLLKNDGTLPLAEGMRVALVGPHADARRDIIGGYTYPAYIEMVKGMAEGKRMAFGGIMDERQKARVERGEEPAGPGEDLLQHLDLQAALDEMGMRSLREVMAVHFDVVYAQGCPVKVPDASGIAEAVEAAKSSDVVVLALGGNCGWGDTTGGEGRDRASLALPGAQQQLLEAVCATGKPVVAVLFGPGVFSATYVHENCAAVLEAWLPGTMGAEAVADVLRGQTNPSGRLPVTVPRHVGQVPITYNHKQGCNTPESKEGTSAVFAGGYTDMEATPLYAFGHGLSYTSFAIEGLALDSGEVATDGTITATCTVKNIGKLQGAEVVQLYYKPAIAHVTRPVMQLAGFAKVALLPGEAKQVRFVLHTSQLAYLNEDMDLVVEPGDMELMVGHASDNIAAKVPLALVGDATHITKRSYTCKAEIL